MILNFTDDLDFEVNEISSPQLLWFEFRSHS